jgi:hypothetical protein
MSLGTIIEPVSPEPLTISHSLGTQALQTAKASGIDGVAASIPTLNEQEAFYIEHFVKHVAPWVSRHGRGKLEVIYY